MSIIEAPNCHDPLEGWAIFHSSGSVDGEWQIQRDDEAQVFESDGQAWKFVYDRAQAGSSPHQEALNFLKENCFPEWVRVDHFGKTGEDLPRDENEETIILEEYQAAAYSVRPPM